MSITYAEERNIPDSSRYRSADRTAVLYNLPCGVYAVTSNDGVRDNGIILNCVIQVTNSPERLAVALNKSSRSHDIILNSGIMNVCCLPNDVSFDIIGRLGFASGRNTDKFADIRLIRSKNGLAVPERYTSCFVSLETEQYIDLGTHGMFICGITEVGVISDSKTLTYDEYRSRAKLS